MAYTNEEFYRDVKKRDFLYGTLNRLLKVDNSQDGVPMAYEWVVVGAAEIYPSNTNGENISFADFNLLETVCDDEEKAKSNLVEILRILRDYDDGKTKGKEDFIHTLSELIDENPEKFIYTVAADYPAYSRRIMTNTSLYEKSELLMFLVTVTDDLARLAENDPAENGKNFGKDLLDFQIKVLRDKLKKIERDEPVKKGVLDYDDLRKMLPDDNEDDSDVASFSDDDDDLNDEELLQKKIDKLDLDDERRHRLHREIKKLETIPTNSIEYYTQYNFLEFVSELPWNIYSDDNYDIDGVSDVLEADHYGIKQVKERILEFIAVQKLVDKPTGTLICLVGAPGVGKTSVAESIARATGKKFCRISLGGIRDEAEIRGHRRTYVAAMAGKIMNEIKKAGTSNPLILLDEIDKLCNDTRGDPSAALLEVLDPAQNKAFVDHFVDMPFDLSRVMFVTTANTTKTIPAPLLDRMEVIEMSGYTMKEKKEIAKKYLVPKQSKANGIKQDIIIDDDALDLIISGYTMESGVRELERNIGKICRKLAMKLVRGNTADDMYVIDVKKVGEYLGVPKYSDDDNRYDDTVGVVNGLAWTSFGGEILPIEVALFKGKDEIIMTGNLGDVMKESARNALSLLRVRAEKYGVDPTRFSDMTVHISSPEGAVPKDGPSAGITLATALYSAYTDKPVKSKLAMTGELSLKGKVLPIGGLKEKLLAAKRAGMTEVIVPDANRKDISELDDEIVGSFDIIYADEFDTVLSHAFSEASL